MNNISHIDNEGQVRMVNITDKESSKRSAIAQSIVFMSKNTFENIINNKILKGNVLETARIAGIMAAKKTFSLIPMCHPLNLTHIQIDFITNSEKNFIKILGSSRVKGATGVEMEALMAVSISALTIYDMCKSNDKAMSISDIFLLKKTGGKSGSFIFSKKTESSI